MSENPTIRCDNCGMPIPEPGQNPDPSALLCDTCYRATDPEKEYLITWQIDMDGFDPVDAVNRAVEALFAKDSQATIYDVTDKTTGEVTRVDAETQTILYAECVVCKDTMTHKDAEGRYVCGDCDPDGEVQNPNAAEQAEPPDHEHGAGCWPGGEKEFECDVMQAFEAMREALTALLPYLQSSPGLLVTAADAVKAAHAALAQADKVTP